MLTARLRGAVGNASLVNGSPISRERLLVEREDLRELLDALMSESTPEKLDTIERLFQSRMLRVSREMRVVLDTDADLLRIFTLPQTTDLGLLNTSLLLELFSRYPVSTLGRCEHCQRFHIPGAEGRKRTRGVLYCSQLCLRTAMNARRNQSH